MAHRWYSRFGLLPPSQSEETKRESDADKAALQRQLADAIGRHEEMDKIRILLASGAKVTEPVVRGLLPLHYAVYECYEEAARLCLVRGTDVNAIDDVGYTAVHLSAERGYISMLKLLLEFGAKISFSDPLSTDMFPREDEPEEPLRLAIKNSHYTTAEFLLINGANPNARYFMGGEIDLLHCEDTAYIDLLLNYGADPDSCDRTGVTPLMKAVTNSKAMDTVLCLIAHGANVNAQAGLRQDCRTVLHYAILGGNRIMVNLLIKQGAKINMDEDYDYPSPLDLAILRDDPEMVILLCQSGANVNSFSSTLGSPLHVACAAHLKNQAVIIYYLLQQGADVNKSCKFDSGAVLRTPLVEYLSSWEEYDKQVIVTLLQAGAKVVFTQPARNLCGVLRSLQHIIKTPELLEILVSISDCCDMGSVRRSVLVPDEVKKMLEKMLGNPLSLTKQIRRQVRRWFSGVTYTDTIERFPLPNRLKDFLQFELD